VGGANGSDHQGGDHVGRCNEPEAVGQAYEAHAYAADEHTCKSAGLGSAVSQAQGKTMAGLWQDVI